MNLEPIKKYDEDAVAANDKLAEIRYRHSNIRDAYQLALLGLNDSQIANFFNVVPSTINFWKKEHQLFDAAIRAGRERADGKVVKALLETALKGDVAAQKFWLSNRNKANWGAEQQVHQTLEVGPVAKESDINERIAALEEKTSDLDAKVAQAMEEF